MNEVDAAFPPFLTHLWTAFQLSCPGARLHLRMDYHPTINPAPGWTIHIVSPNGAVYAHEGIGSLLDNLTEALVKAADAMERSAAGNVVYLSARRS